MQPYPDPLGAGEPPALANALPPLPGYAPAPAFVGDSFGDALAEASPGADPTAAPLSALGGSVFAADFGGTDFGGTDFAGTDFGGTDFGGTDFGGTDPAERAEVPADRLPVAGTAAERLAEPAETTTMGLEIPPEARRAAPRASAAPVGGRYELGIPRGYDPPSVPANRGWASPSAPPPPRERRPPRRTGRPQARRTGQSQPSALWQPGTRQPGTRQQGSWPPPQPGTWRQTAPRLGTPDGAPPLRPGRPARPGQPARSGQPGGWEIPPEYGELIQRSSADRPPNAALPLRLGIALVLVLIAVLAGIDHNWATTAVFAGLTLIVIRPRPRPSADRLAAAQAAAERRRRANASDWPRRN